MKEHDPAGRRLPIKIDTASNGERPPEPLTPAEIGAKRCAHQFVSECSRRLGQSRRTFLKSACGAAAVLLAFNRFWSSLGLRGGLFEVPEAAAFDEQTASSVLDGNELIVDMQTHCVDPRGKWAKGADGKRWMRNLTEVFGQASQCPYNQLDCYSAQRMIKEVFLDSDTDVAVISALWGAKGHNPTPTEYAAEARDMILAQIGKRRALIHGGVLPNEAGQIEFMDVQAKEFKVDAWKLYPQWGPNGVGMFMDDPKYGIPMLEKARKLGIKIVCAHRGLPFSTLAYEYSNPEDIVRVGRMFPDLTFVCYHAGFEPGVTEGYYRPERNRGVDRLIKAYIDHGYRPDEGNVYAELGTCWRYFMSKPDQAAHLMGKLVKYLGEERICWGTDAIWYGSPQDQIQMFRTFTITPEFQEKYGYPPLTKEAKRKIFGLNAARLHDIDVAGLQQQNSRDRISRLRESYADNRNPSFLTYGPKTNAEFNRLVRKV